MRSPAARDHRRDLRRLRVLQAVAGGTMVAIDDDDIFLPGVGVDTVTQTGDFILAA